MIETCFNARQPLNALYPMLVTLFGMLTDVKPLHSEKALRSILFTDSGMTILVSPVQPSNAPSLITVTDSGMTILVSPVQPLYLEVIDYQLFVVNTVEKWIGCYLWVYGK